MPVNAWGQIYIGSSTPQEDPVQVGSLWTDTVNNLLKRCTSVSPYTWVSTEGGSSAHALDSGTHTGVSAMTEAKGMLIAHDGGTWVGLGVGTNGQHLEADSAAGPGLKWATPSGGGSHTLDSASHTDVAALTEAKGDILVNTGSQWNKLAVGSNGQLLEADSAEATGLKWLTREYDWLRYRRTGRAHYGGGTRSSQALAADTMRAVPFMVAKAISVDAISIEVGSAGGAGSNVILAVYTDDGNGYPSALVSGTTSAELDTSTTGLKRSTFTPVNLNPNTLYWLVIHTDATATAPTLRATFPLAFEFIVGLADNTAPGSAANAFWSVARTYDGAMPATFPSGGVTVTGNTYIVALEVA